MTFLFFMKQQKHFIQTTHEIGSCRWKKSQLERIWNFQAFIPCSQERTQPTNWRGN